MRSAFYSFIGLTLLVAFSVFYIEGEVMAAEKKASKPTKTVKNIKKTPTKDQKASANTVKPVSSARSNKKSASEIIEQAEKLTDLVQTCQENNDIASAKRYLSAMSALGNGPRVRLERARASSYLIHCMIGQGLSINEILPVFNPMRQLGNASDVLRLRSNASAMVIGAYSIDREYSSVEKEERALKIFSAMKKLGHSEEFLFDQAEAAISMIEIYAQNKRYAHAYELLESMTYWGAPEQFKPYQISALISLVMHHGQTGEVGMAEELYNELKDMATAGTYLDEIDWAAVFMAEAYQKSGQLENAERMLASVRRSNTEEMLWLLWCETSKAIAGAYVAADKTSEVRRMYKNIPESSGNEALRQLFASTRQALDNLIKEPKGK